jgi:hypothetical protein
MPSISRILLRVWRHEWVLAYLASLGLQGSSNTCGLRGVPRYHPLLKRQDHSNLVASCLTPLIFVATAQIGTEFEVRAQLPPPRPLKNDALPV